jgi:hypothetical protein
MRAWGRWRRWGRARLAGAMAAIGTRSERVCARSQTGSRIAQLMTGENTAFSLQNHGSLR